MEKVTNGPFGSYKRKQMGHVLNSLLDVPVPLSIVEKLNFEEERVLKLDGSHFARYKYFDGIEAPLFNFNSTHYGNHETIVDKHGAVSIKFKLSLSIHNTPGVVVNGVLATPELHEFMQGMLTNWTNDPRYAIHQAAAAFFQGGSHDPNGKFIYIEFWKPEGAQAFVDYVNEHYKPTFVN